MTREEHRQWAETTRALTGRWPIGARVVPIQPGGFHDFHGTAVVIDHVELTGANGLLLKLQNGVLDHALTHRLKPE